MAPKNRLTQRRLALRQSYWPDSAQYCWPQDPGWFKCPRILPVVLALIDELSEKGKDVGRTYLDLFSRSYDEGLIVDIDEQEAAMLSGFGGKRGERSWAERIRILEELGFIKVKEIGANKFGAILLINPGNALYELRRQNRLKENLWALFLKKCADYSIMIFEDPLNPRPPVAPPPPAPASLLETLRATAAK